MTDKKELLAEIKTQCVRLNYNIRQLQNSWNDLTTTCRTITHHPVTSLDGFLMWYLTPKKLWNVLGVSFLAGTMAVPMLPRLLKRRKRTSANN